jgi:hypothetical protein
VKTPVKLSLFGAGLVAVFAAAFGISGAVVPAGTVANWKQAAKGHTMKGHAATTALHGVAIGQDGYLLTRLTAPNDTTTSGTISFTIAGPTGAAVTEFDTAHDKKLHLIVVRADGAQFRHVHPTIDAGGTWSVPWRWAAAGTYRVYADIVPAATGENITLTSTIDVAGQFTPAAPTAVSGTDSVAGFDVTLDGTLSSSEQSMLRATVTRDGGPVTTLQPYLGAYGHLVALRQGDLAFLHVHPEGDEPRAGSVSGPSVEFMTEAPTPGRYLLYLDFQVDGQVHTAEFVLDATGH